ncbi:MAG: hypothetical protein AB7N76_03100 [Planctomycetota bacterium]
MSWHFSKFLIQSFPPDRAEAKERWAFGVYEILDERRTPVDPRVLHVTYRGVVELSSEEVPDPEQPDFTARLEDAVVAKWKTLSSQR